MELIPSLALVSHLSTRVHLLYVAVYHGLFIGNGYTAHVASLSSYRRFQLRRLRFHLLALWHRSCSVTGHATDGHHFGYIHILVLLIYRLDLPTQEHPWYPSSLRRCALVLSSLRLRLRILCILHLGSTPIVLTTALLGYASSLMRLARSLLVVFDSARSLHRLRWHGPELRSSTLHGPCQGLRPATQRSIPTMRASRLR